MHWSDIPPASLAVLRGGAVMPDWVAHWIKREQPTFNKPAKFEVRDGSF